MTTPGPQRPNIPALIAQWLADNPGAHLSLPIADEHGTIVRDDGWARRSTVP